MKKTPVQSFSLILSLTVFGVTAAFAVSDDAREKFFHEVYSRYNAVPTSSATWERLVNQAQVNVYSVQAGDTLWDISNTLFADSQFWPKLWAENSAKIFNPHQIEPGQEILFYAGSSSTPPSFAPAASENNSSENKLSQNSNSSSVTGSNTNKPKKRVPHLDKIPRSFAEVTFDANPYTFPELPSNFGQREERPTESALATYISEESIKDIKDHIVATEIGSETASLGDIIFVSLEEPIGKTYHVVTEEPILNEKVARLIRVHGQIEVLGKASSTKPVYKARVSQNLSQVFSGTKLLEGDIPYFSTDSKGQVSSVTAKIIGGEFAKNRMMSLGQLVFLDAGSSVGVQENDLMNIYLNPNIRAGKDVSDMNYKPIGIVKVIQLTSNFSTAYVLSVSDDVRVGDWIGLRENMVEVE